MEMIDMLVYYFRDAFFTSSPLSHRPHCASNRRHFSDAWFGSASPRHTRLVELSKGSK
jgi:hypothetical protein